MGLDWTAALLPAERPSWSTSSLQPVSPPSSFTLPEPITSYIPHPEKIKYRIQRTATWRWEDTEWRPIIHLNDSISVAPSRSSNVIKPTSSRSPSSDSPNRNEDKEASKFDSTKRLRDRLKDKIAEQNIKADNDHHEIYNEVSGDEVNSQSEDEARTITQNGEKYTDADGWIYGDNKWESTSDKGGMGKVSGQLFTFEAGLIISLKYTRIRRWTRIAILREESEEIGPGFTGVVRAPPAQSVVSTDVSSPTLSNKDNTSPLPSPNEQGTTASDRLRQRLQAAMRRESISN